MNGEPPDSAGSSDWGRRLLGRLRLQARRSHRALRRYVAVLRDQRIPRRTRAAYLAAGASGVAAAVFVLVLLYGILLIPFTPGMGEIRKAKSERPTVILARGGEELAELKPLNRDWVSLDAIAPEVVYALVATEDHRFYRHSGVDFKRLAGAGLRTLTGSRQGGSTITQQLARNLYPEEIGRKTSLTRKLKEMITAFKIEYAYTKDEILETYLNTVPFLYNAYGIEMAARTYFGKSASQLELLESATLVGMLKGTYYYNPVRAPERALERRNVVLRQMVKRGNLQEDRYEALKDSPLGVRFSRQEEQRGPAPHFVRQVRSWLIDWTERRGYNIYRDSLRVHTSLDVGMQAMSRQAVDRWMPALQAIAAYEWDRSQPGQISRSPEGYRYAVADGDGFDYLWTSNPQLMDAFIRQTPQYRSGISDGADEQELLDSLRSDAEFLQAIRELKTRLETGFVAMDPETGGVRTWIGSRDYEIDQYDHVARARRQPGSTFKPFVYAAALEEGYRPTDKFLDAPVEMELKGGEVWRPQNSGSYSNQELTLADGLIYSKNTITAQLVQEVGTRDVARLARRMGVRRSRLTEVPSIALGTSEVSLLEMVAAYSTFANGGIYRPPVMVTRIEDRFGKVIYEARERERRVLSEETSYRVIEMLQGVVDRGTGTRIRETFGIHAAVAGKTGTTTNNADGWFIMMHPRLVGGAWVGFNDPRVAFRSEYWGQGGNNALFVVGEFFRRAMNGGVLETRDAAFPPAPPYPEGPESLVDRIVSFIGSAAEDVGSFFASIIEFIGDKIFGRSTDEDQVLPPEERPGRRSPEYRYVEDDIYEDREWEEADSLTRMERDSTQLWTILERARAGRGETPEPPGQEGEAPPGQRGDGPPGQREGGPPEEAVESEEGPPGRSEQGPPGQSEQGPPGQSEEGPPGQRE